MIIRRGDIIPLQFVQKIEKIYFRKLIIVGLT